MKKENQSAQEHNISPERIIDAKLYEQLQTLQRVKIECGVLFATYSHQGVKVSRMGELELYKDIDNCILALSCLASEKFTFELKKGGTL